MNIYLLSASIAIIVSMIMLVIRAFAGPTIYDRLLAANSFGTKTVLLIGILSVLVDPMYLDIALIYVTINFIATIGFLKYFEKKSLGCET